MLSLYVGRLVVLVGLLPAGTGLADLVDGAGLGRSDEVDLEVLNGGLDVTVLAGVGLGLGAAVANGAGLISGAGEEETLVLPPLFHGAEDTAFVPEVEAFSSVEVEAFGSGDGSLT